MKATRLRWPIAVVVPLLVACGAQTEPTPEALDEPAVRLEDDGPSAGNKLDGPPTRSAQLPWAFAGQTEIDVHVYSTGEFRVESVASNGSTEILGSTKGSRGRHCVALSRPLVEGEILSLFDVSTSRSRSTRRVFSDTDGFVFGVKDLLRMPRVGDDVVFSGRALTGTESVRALGEGGGWTSCAVRAWSADSLTVELPGLGQTEHGTVVFEITTPAGDEFTHSVFGGKP